MRLSSVYNWLKSKQPGRCILCLNPGQYRCRDLCDGCHADLPWLINPCRLCALPLAAPGQLCGQCQTRRPSYAQVIAPFEYRFPLDSLIPAFKHNEQLAFGRLLARLMADAIAFEYQEREQALPDRLLVMPLHRKRLAQRGFNQAQELARPIARQLGVGLANGLLRRTRATPAQQGLSASKRRRNLLGAFDCPQPQRLEGLHLALVDDVVTTGSTIEEASRTLLAAGASSVSIWCAARTPDSANAAPQGGNV